MKIPEYIFDRYDERYTTEVEEDSEASFYIKIKDGEAYIGQMYCSFQPDASMILEDLFIRSDVEVPKKWSPDRKLSMLASEFPSGLLASALPQKRRKLGNVIMNYRNRGLGSALLLILFDLAKDREMKTIFGSLIKEDIKINPHLQEWYVKRGFTVSGQFKGCIPEAQSYIRFDVPRGY